jgi:hypothetical protein
MLVCSWFGCLKHLDHDSNDCLGFGKAMDGVGNKLESLPPVPVSIWSELVNAWLCFGDNSWDEFIE